MTDNELLQQIAKELTENTRQTALLTQAVMGNGVKGLADRMGELEEWRDTHPRVCPVPELQQAVADLERAPGKQAQRRLGELRKTVITAAVAIALTLGGLGVYHWAEQVPYHPAATQGSKP